MPLADRSWEEELSQCAMQCAATPGCGTFMAERGALWAVCAFFRECHPRFAPRMFP